MASHTNGERAVNSCIELMTGISTRKDWDREITVNASPKGTHCYGKNYRSEGCEKSGGLFGGAIGNKTDD